MEGFSVCNSTNYKIFISIFNQATKIESAWLEPLNQGKKQFRTNKNYQPGIYRIQSEIIPAEGDDVLKTSVYVNLPSSPIKIETDDYGNFWWRLYADKSFQY